MGSLAVSKVRGSSPLTSQLGKAVKDFSRTVVSVEKQPLRYLFQSCIKVVHQLLVLTVRVRFLPLEIILLDK